MPPQDGEEIFKKFLQTITAGHELGRGQEGLLRNRKQHKQLAGRDSRDRRLVLTSP